MFGFRLVYASVLGTENRNSEIQFDIRKSILSYGPNPKPVGTSISCLARIAASDDES
jgi:hypothetical protein